MIKIAENVIDLIGRTPMLQLSTFQKNHDVNAQIVAKLESFNPGGSAKDRIGLAMITDAERKGLLQPGSTIIEPTSGNTGIGLAMVAAVKGYKVVLTMPDTMSIERRRLLAAYGAEIILTEGIKGMAGAVEKAKVLAEQLPNSFIPSQFENPSNAQAHYETTGPEIWADTDGKVAVFIATFGTGGTLSGVGRYLKKQNPDIRIIGVEPAASPLLSKGYAGAHQIQGIGANFIPEVLDRDVYDEVISVTDAEAFSAAKSVARTEGLLVGISSGAALAAALAVAQRSEYMGKMIAVVLPDTGERYLSTEVFQ
ncbi:cysteine synthase A [Oscillospiraceae bacterium LTW-04]|nr:cysteine synthase A [Oscillospiraceae bacterium MB24-C1]